MSTKHTPTAFDAIRFGRALECLNPHEQKNIVRCVNAHEQLVEACRDAMWFISPVIDDEEDEGRVGSACKLHDKLRAALAAAEGK